MRRALAVVAALLALGGCGSGDDTTNDAPLQSGETVPRDDVGSQGETSGDNQPNAPRTGTGPQAPQQP